MVKSLKFKDNALRWVAYLVRLKHNSFFNICSLADGKHFLLSPPLGSDLPFYYVLFKREFFLSFNLVFKDFVSSYPDYNTIGESLNVEIFKSVVARKVDFILFVYDNSKVYSLSVDLLKKFYAKYDLVRKQEKLNITSKDCLEETICFPINIMERFGNV